MFWIQLVVKLLFDGKGGTLFEPTDFKQEAMRLYKEARFVKTSPGFSNPGQDSKKIPLKIMAFDTN
jgi:hypothetical protein